MHARAAAGVASIARVAEPPGTSARLSHVGTRWSALGLALCPLVAGCGQATLTTSHVPQGRPRVVMPAAQSLDGNRHAAQREATRLLSLTRVPPGAVPTSARPSQLDGPALGMAAATSLVDRTHFWRLPMGIDATMAWIRAHPPRGLKPAGSSSGAGPTYQLLGVAYSEPDRLGMEDLELAIGVATLAGGGSAIRADGMAIWLDPRPLRDTSTGRRVRVTIAGGCPARDTGDVGVRLVAGEERPDLDARLLPAVTPTAAVVCDYSGLNGHPANHLLRTHRLDASSARTLTKAVAGLALGHAVGEVFHCPFADGTASVLVFSYANRPDVDLWVERNGCPFVSNGRIISRPGSLGAALTRAEGAAS